MNKLATKFAASTLVVAVTMAGFNANVFAAAAATSSSERADRQAARVAEQARAAHQRGNSAEALRLAERAVELAPRDSGYRMLLADIYLRAGRFQSAESTYGDVLALDTGNERAGLSIALVRIALGRTGAALEQLEAIRDRANAGDVGLAYALAGQPQRAIEILEPAARAAGATGRTRQNLALAYAFAGDWQRARTVAAQDVSPAELGGRLQQWAALARPGAPGTAVATLLGVSPAADSGQPVQLALAAPVTAVQAYAEAAPVEAYPAEAYPAEAPAPVQVAAAPAPMPVPAPQPVRYVETAAAASSPAPAVPAGEAPNWWPSSGDSEPAAPAPAAVASAPVVPVAVASAPVEPVAAPAPRILETRYANEAREPAAAPVAARVPALLTRPAPRARPASAIRLPRAGAGRFVVQLGAFVNPANADRAWRQASSRFGLGDAQPHRATITLGGRTFHRVAIGGFSSHAEAVRVCGSVRARGGVCFVRGMAGDTPTRWAGRSVRAGRG